MNTLTGDELLDLYIEAWTKLDAEIIIPHLVLIPGDSRPPIPVILGHLS